MRRGATLSKWSGVLNPPKMDEVSFWSARLEGEPIELHVRDLAWVEDQNGDGEPMDAFRPVEPD